MQSVPATALARLAVLLEGFDSPWVIGGSTGLALRGARLEKAPGIRMYFGNERTARF